MQAAVHIREGEGLIRIRVLYAQVRLWTHWLRRLRFAEDQTGHVAHSALIVIRADVVPSLRWAWLLRLGSRMISRYVRRQGARLCAWRFFGFAGWLSAAACI